MISKYDMMRMFWNIRLASIAGQACESHLSLSVSYHASMLEARGLAQRAQELRGKLPPDEMETITATGVHRAIQTVKVAAQTGNLQDTDRIDLSSIISLRED